MSYANIRTSLACGCAANEVSNGLVPLDIGVCEVAGEVTDPDILYHLWEYSPVPGSEGPWAQDGRSGPVHGSAQAHFDLCGPEDVLLLWVSSDIGRYF